ncbi:MAG: hypothetical protein JSS27_11165 [Planctomycetes bacterium]|nr:hypothetical protein [Planctomycetota bacterium]
MSSLLTIAIYFKFNRLWSLRNLDLLALIALAPGLFLAEFGGASEHWGFVWLFTVGGVLMIRMLADPMMVRRPLLEPNMTTGGLAFIGASLFLFLMANVMMKDVTEADLDGPRRVWNLLERTSAPDTNDSLAEHGPGYPLLHLLPSMSMRQLVKPDGQQPASEENAKERANAAAARVMAILSHLAVVLGLVVIGIRHYDNVRTGIAVATLYLMLPYTAAMTGRVEHVLPAALLVWAVAAYRRPLVSGMLIGLAIGTIYYPLFLLPLWCSFYWQRGLLRFGLGVLTTVAALVLSLALTSHDLPSFLTQIECMFGFNSLSIEGLSRETIHGFWSGGGTIGAYRIPVIVACGVLSVSYALWPAQKNLGTLVSCSSAVMLSTQFWQAQGGGLHMAWYLPLMLLTIFRPNLEDRVAISTLDVGWFLGRRRQLRVRAA